MNDAFGVLHSVDSNTGIPTTVGTLREPGGPVLNEMLDIAEDSAGNLFGIWGVSSNLFSIDRANALASHVGFSGTTGLRGLAFDDADNLYATRADRGGLFAIDTSNGQAQFIGLVSDGALEYFLEDIAFDLDGVLYGVGTSGSPISRLVTIDPATGEAALIGVLNVSLVNGLAFDSNNNLFGVTRTGLMISIDTATAAAALVSSNGVMAFGAASSPLRDSGPGAAPEPSSLALLGLGLAGVVSLRARLGRRDRQAPTQGDGDNACSYGHTEWLARLCP